MMRPRSDRIGKIGRLAAGLAAAGVAVLVGVGAAVAQSDRAIDRLFTVYGVAVDVTDRTAAAARARALLEAQHRALVGLAFKIAAADDVARLPRLSDGRVERLVHGIEIVEERSSPTRYIATVNVTFDAAGIRSLMTGAGLPYTESAAPRTVVLPIFRHAGVGRLWQRDNLWAQAWRSADSDNRLAEYVLPAGSFADRRTISATLADARNADALAAIARAYDASRVLIAEAWLPPAYTSQARVAFRYQLWPDASQQGQGQIFGAEARPTADLMVRAAEAAMGRLDLTWKERTLLGIDQGGVVEADTPLAAADDWLAIIRGLEEIATVRDVTVLQLGLPISRVRIDYVGTPDQLDMALRQVALELIEVDGRFILRRADKADRGGSRSR